MRNLRDGNACPHAGCSAIIAICVGVFALLTFALSFLVVADVIGRVVFNSPVKGTPEIVSMSIVIICFLLAGYLHMAHVNGRRVGEVICAPSR